MKNFIKTVIATSATLSAFAAPSNPSTPAINDPNPSARWGTASTSNWFITGEAVWFKPLVSQIAQSTVAQGADYTEKRVYFQNEFQIGGRVSVGYNTCYDGWDTVFTYTRLNYSQSNPFINQLQGANYTGTLTWGYLFNQGALDVGRMFSVSKNLKLRPYTGIRGAWLQETTTSKYTNNSFPTRDKLDLKDIMIGLNMGLNTTWLISKEFSVYSNLAVASLVDRESATFTTTQNNALTHNSSTNDGAYVVNVIDFALGLRWDRNFSNNNYHVSINLGYEQHSFLNINTIADLELQGLGNFEYNTSADFNLQGLTIGARFDF